MPSKSKAQQKFFGIVHGVQKGEINPNKVSKKVKDTAKEMKPKDVKDFASTKRAKLPNRIKREIIQRLKEYPTIDGRDTALHSPTTALYKKDFGDKVNFDVNDSGQPDLDEYLEDFGNARYSDKHSINHIIPKNYDDDDVNFNPDGSGQPDLDENKIKLYNISLVNLIPKF